MKSNKWKETESSNVFFLICQSENVSVLEKVSKPALSSFVLKIYIYIYFFYPPVVFLETRKQRRKTAELEEAAPRASLWKQPPPRPSWLPLGDEEQLVSRTQEMDWISRWISDRPFSSDRLCTTCLFSPCRTPFDTSSPHHEVSLVTADVTA